MQKPILVSLIGILLSVASFGKENLSSNLKQPLHFLENNGQVKDEQGEVRSDIKFALSGGGMSVFIGNGSMHYQFSKIDNPEVIGKDGLSDEEVTASFHQVTVELIGANKLAVAVPEEKQVFVARYYEMSTDATGGHLQVDKSIEAASYNKITYKEVYPNIDWVIYTKGDNVEYDFVIKPGGDPANIRLKYSGATQLKINELGGLTATTPMGTIEEHKPYSYQADGKEVPSSFKLEGDVVSFNIGSYNGVLTIDPSVVWSSYFGGENVEDIRTSISLDAQGNVYLAGSTMSTSNISTNGTTYSGAPPYNDGYIAKFDEFGTAVWATYWGTPALERINSIEVDGQNNVYIAGMVTHLTAYLVKFTSSGTFVNSLLWNGETTDEGFKVVCDNSNNIYYGGKTSSTTGIPIVNAYQPVKNDFEDAFLVKLDPDMNILWATYYGGNHEDNLTDMAVDHLGNLYITGHTLSDTELVTLGPIILPTNWNYSVYIAKFSPDGNRIWGAMFGGQAHEFSPSIAVDTMDGGGVYIGGQTYSGADIATPGAYQTQLNGSTDGILARYDTSGVKLWATYVGGQHLDGFSDLAVHPSGIYLVGATASTDISAENGWQGNLVQGVQAGDGDAIVSKFSKSGEHIWSSYYGGTFADAAWAIEVNNAGDIYFSGYTQGGGFLTNTTHQGAYGGGVFDAFIVKVSTCSQLAEWPIDGDAGICLGDNKVYTVPSSSWTTSAYSWSVTGELAGSSVNSDITVTGNAVGNGVITVSANNGCDTIHEIKNVVVHPLPAPAITSNGNQLSTGSFSSYQWNLNGTPIPGATNQDHTASADGEYTVTVTDGNGCEGTSATSPVGVATLGGRAASLIIAPNPSDGDFIISGYLPSTNPKADMVIVDVTGSVIYKTQLKVVNNQVQHPVRLEESVAPGIYYIKLMSDATSQVIRFVKQ